jgi:3-deoxy-D-arabino-heptulosonate 7-phosphate (DAHP) synthase class II
MSRQADEHAATVAEFEAAMRREFERLEADISADWQLAFTERTTVERAANAELLRCVVGNPFRSVVFAPEWRSETVVRIADAIDADRAFDRLPVLADALEDAGCDAPDVLAHCRGPGPHARGCWVVNGVRGAGAIGI